MDSDIEKVMRVVVYVRQKTVIVLFERREWSQRELASRIGPDKHQWIGK